MSSFIIAVVGIELFPQRMHLDKEFGEVVYLQLISILELIGKEVPTSEIPHYRLGVYLDSNNPGTRKFSLEEKEFNIVCDHFGHSFHKSLSSYAKREQKKGTNVLFLLNSGDISMRDFVDRLSKMS